MYEDKENGASLLISRTNSSFSVRGVLGPDRAIRPRPDSAAPSLPTHSSCHQIPDRSHKIDPAADSGQIPPHWLTIANHPLPGTDYQVNTQASKMEKITILKFAGGGRWRR